MTVLSHRESSLQIGRVLYPMRKFKVTVERVAQICVGIAAFVFLGAVRTVLGYGIYCSSCCFSFTQPPIPYLTPPVFSFPTTRSFGHHNAIMTGSAPD